MVVNTEVVNSGVVNINVVNIRVEPRYSTTASFWSGAAVYPPLDDAGGDTAALRNA